MSKDLGRRVLQDSQLGLSGPGVCEAQVMGRNLGAVPHCVWDWQGMALQAGGHLGRTGP